MSDEELTAALIAAIDRVNAAEQAAKEANTERKTARNKLAELLQAAGVTGFTLGAS